MTLSITILCYYAESCYAECHILFTIMLYVIMLIVIMLSVVMMRVIMLSVVMLRVVMLCVIMLNVLAPLLRSKIDNNASWFVSIQGSGGKMHCEGIACTRLL